jgi:hypothetical protein
LINLRLVCVYACVLLLENNGNIIYIGFQGFIGVFSSFFHLFKFKGVCLR